MLDNSLRRQNPKLAGSEAILELKISIAKLEHHLELNENLDVVREYENRVKKLVEKCKLKRESIQNKK